MGSSSSSSSSSSGSASSAAFAALHAVVRSASWHVVLAMLAGGW